MESVSCGPSMRRGIGQRVDDPELFNDRAGPAMRDDQRQRILVFRANVDEMNVQPIDLGDELRQRVEPRLDLAPIVLRSPVARDLLDRCELDALRFICDLVSLMRRRISTSAFSAT